MEASTESTLIVVIPEAESLVGPFRARYDPVSAEGVPAHVTVLYPFLPPARITAGVEMVLEDVFASASTFVATFDAIREFPGVLYVAPSVDIRFRRLTEAVFAAFPAAPPYGGIFADIIPHLTVAHAPDAAQLAHIRSDLEIAARSSFPVVANVREVALFERQGNRWRERRRFALGGSETATVS